VAYKLSAAGLEDLKNTEAMRLSVYDDKDGRNLNSYEEARGYPTIGIGLLIDSAEKREKYRPYLGGKKADKEWMWKESLATVRRFESDLNKRIGDIKLTQSMFDALFSLAWNTGTASRWVKEVIQKAGLKDYDGAAEVIAKGPVTSKGAVMQGLVARRAREAKMFLQDGIPKGLAILKSPKFYWTASAIGSVGLVYWILKRNKVI
jgi:GH24 family phage-related lysozyme (muramidase)